ncbi:uncharacterized protein LOC124914895 isoform X2 [Impatiens glandulifera]|uniref:uncharacterized protein LOC124914895 isoform X2 n=1 Tax=Impatiens glandulifera TaxID=253017 RepID=UPI001FB1A1D4|nr:uncharacterized protein LOC124914895 isoform X2 [Impatiens glandulifera]
MAKTVVSQRKHGDAGLEAPRNSLDLLGQTCAPGGGVGDYLPYSYELFKHEWSKIHREEEDSMKNKFVSRETTTTNNNRVPNTRRTTPSVVARLMGMDMDMFPSSVQNHQRKQVRNNFNTKNENNMKTQEDIHHVIINHRSHRPEHPQEEELQKFKKEFESWQQTARFKRTIPEQKMHAQETLKREETVLYSDSRRRRISNEKPIKALEDQRFGNSSSGPNKIVLLRPGSTDRLADSEEESWVGGSSSTNSIEEFLEEVKERLKSEFQGKYCHNKRGTSEKPLDAMKKKQIEKQIRESEIQIINETNSFRHAPDDSVHIMHHHREPSLIRSLSAPVSGTSFGKLLLEDPHVLTGAHIQRKHEAVEKKMKKKKKNKEKLEIKETVSNFKQSFTLGGQLFRRRFQSADDMYSCRNDIMSGPTVVMNYGNIIQENATEVPPSPASSLSELSPQRESSLPQVFREINSNLSELRRQLNALDAGSEEDELPEVDMMEENQAETYIRELLIVSGLYNYYNNTITTTLSRRGEKPINNRVFKKVEKSYMNKSKNSEDSKMNRQLLFDLTNEAIVEQSMTSRSKLLSNNVWERVRTYLYPIPEDKFRYSIDGMVRRDLRSAPWIMLVKDEEIDYLGKMMENQIIARLIEEVVKDLQQLHLERRWRKYNR